LVSNSKIQTEIAGYEYVMIVHQELSLD